MRQPAAMGVRCHCTERCQRTSQYRCWRHAFHPRETTPMPTSHYDQARTHEVAPSGQPRLPHRRRCVPGQAGTVVFVLLSLIFGLVTTRATTSEAPEATRWVPALVRAMATTSRQVVDTPLIEATFSLDELPSGEKGVLYYRLTLPPGAHLPYLAGPYCGCHDETVTKGV